MAKKQANKKTNKQVRQKTGYKNIYFNQTTNKYDVKYNYKVYDPMNGKNKYQSKWVYNLATLKDAQDALARLRNGGMPQFDKNITLDGIHQVWIQSAKSNNYSVKTVQNTENQLKIIYQFLPKSTRLKDISPAVYDKLFADCRAAGYSEETLHSVNACLYKMLNLAWSHDYILVNPLEKATKKQFDTARTIEEDSEKIITSEEYYKIDEYCEKHSYKRKGVDVYVGYRALFAFLYYTGVRIGEALAVRYCDIRRITYDKNGNRKVAPYDFGEDKGAQYDGFEVFINKVRLSSGQTLTYEEMIRDKTKNKKNRKIPMDFASTIIPIDLWMDEAKASMEDRVFPWTDSNVRNKLKDICESLEIQHHSPHDFRHTFISNLMADPDVSLADVEMVSGDVQATILARYSHILPEARKKLESIVAKW